MFETMMQARVVSMVFVGAALAACGGAQRGGGGGEACPSTPAKVSAACGCRPSELKFIATIKENDWSGGFDPTPLTMQCADGTKGPGIADCVVAGLPAGDVHALAAKTLVPAYKSVAETADDSKFTACAAPLQK